MRNWIAAAALAAPIVVACPAVAQAAPAKFGDPVKVSEGLTIDPIVDARLRWEHVDQDTVPVDIDADAVTLRLRAGAEFRMGRLAALIEGEGVLAIGNNYNAFPFAIPNGQRRPQYATVPDPETIGLNRLQLQYKTKTSTFTLGRQRINLDDQRWVGSVGWRQDEQTFDAVRAEAKFGPISLDGTYAISQRTIFGIDAGPRQSYDGEFVFAGATARLGPVNVKGFAYVIDYDESIAFANSSQTYGGRAVAAIPLAPKVKLNLVGSYARQWDHGRNPVNYAADFVNAEAGISVKALTLTAGWEKLGSDKDAAGGAGKALQTPLATLHKFNGWADVFLTTPAKGLQDFYASAAYKFDGVKVLPGLNAAVAWHKFESDVGGLKYGNELNASLGFKLGSFAILAKYADYNAKGFAVDSKRFWLQAEIAY